jgi:hypothetical protein
MTRYRADHGDWSDPDWKRSEAERDPRGRGSRIVLPPWALLATIVGILIVLCVMLGLLIQSCRGAGGRATPTPTLAPTRTPVPTLTPTPMLPPTAIPPTDTPVPPTETPTEEPSATEIGPGATVQVRGVGAAGLSIRAQPTTGSARVGIAREGSLLTVIGGPREAGGYVWWQVRTADGTEGWVVANWLVLQTGQ